MAPKAPTAVRTSNFVLRTLMYRFRRRRWLAARLGLKRQGRLRRRLAHRGGQVETEQLRHVLDLRQIREVVEAEASEDLAGRAVHDRTANDLLAANDLDELPLHQRPEHARGVDAANL